MKLSKFLLDCNLIPALIFIFYLLSFIFYLLSFIFYLLPTAYWTPDLPVD